MRRNTKTMYEWRKVYRERGADVGERFSRGQPP